MPSSQPQAAVRSSQPFLWISKALFSFQLSTRATLAYLALAYYRNTKSGACENMTVRTMAARVGIGESTMIRGLAELQKKGVIRIRHRSKKSAAGNRIPLASLYELVDIDAIGGDPI